MRSLKLEEYEIENETDEEQRLARRYHPATVVIWRGHRNIIGAGSTDRIWLFEEGGELFVTAKNCGLGYIGLQIFSEGAKVGDVFLEEHDSLGAHALKLSPIYAAKTLAAYCY